MSFLSVEWLKNKINHESSVSSESDQDLDRSDSSNISKNVSINYDYEQNNMTFHEDYIDQTRKNCLYPKFIFTVFIDLIKMRPHLWDEIVRKFTEK